MTYEITNTASAEAEPKKVEPLEQPKTEQAATPASETPVEEWDKERAKETILKLREIEKQAKKNEKEFERLKAEEQKRLEAQMTETERLQKRADELAKQNAEYQAQIMRRDVIAKTGLPLELADRLKGDTLEALEADAKELLKLLPKTKNNQPVHNPANASSEMTAEQRHAARQASLNPFNLENAYKMGGGVVENK